MDPAVPSLVFDTGFLLLQGVAGSGKTHALVIYVADFVRLQKKPVLCVTQISSVTLELISRLEQELDIKFKKQGKSGHYKASYKKVPLVVCTFDAWVFNMCATHKLSEDLDHTEYAKKVQRLSAALDHNPLPCQLKNTVKPAGLIMVDEAQDLDPNKMDLLIKMCRVWQTANEPPKLHMYIAGDELQTLNADIARRMNPMNKFKQLQPVQRNLVECKRCPREQVEFANLVCGPMYEDHGLMPMTSTKETSIYFPFLMGHLSMTDDQRDNCVQNAKMFAEVIKLKMQQDPSLKPGDIAIIMFKTYNSQFYSLMLQVLADVYETTFGIKDAVIHLASKFDGNGAALDWANAEGKTKLMSIMAAKGKQFPFVLALGLTENSVPMEQLVNKPEELAAKSNMYVALTRSTKYLVVGFQFGYPSRYFWKQNQHLASHAYCAWADSTHFPAPYRKIALYLKATSQAFKPFWGNNYSTVPSLGGTRTKLQVRDDISQECQDLSLLCPGFDFQTKTTTMFGTPVTLETTLTPAHLMILGNMIELLVTRRKVGVRAFDAWLTLMFTSEYSSDLRLLTCMHELRLNYAGIEAHHDAKLDEFFHTYRDNNIPELLKRQITSLFKRNVTVVHTAFDTEGIRQNINEFMSDKPNESLSTRCLWNMALLYSTLTQAIFRPTLTSFIDYLQEDLSALHRNIDAFIATHHTPLHAECRFEVSLGQQVFLDDPDMLKALKKTRPYTIGVSGRCDLYHPHAREVVEFKASGAQDCMKEWIVQTVMYAVMLRHAGFPVDRMTVANIMSGQTYSWNIAMMDTTFQDIVQTVIAPHYDWHPIEIDLLLTSLLATKTRHKRVAVQGDAWDVVYPASRAPALRV